MQHTLGCFLLLQLVYRLLSSSPFSNHSPHIPDGESLSCYTFCQLACGMLKAIGDFLDSGIDEVVSRMFVYPDSESSEDEASTRHQVYEACRGFQSVFGEARERAVKALAFAKTLRKDLEAREKN